MPFEPNAGAWGEIDEMLSDSMKSASRSMENRLYQKLGRGARSGRHWAKYPARSSAVGEYPQEQFGSLRDSVNTNEAGKSRMLHAWQVGFFNENMQKLYELELKQWEGQRKPLTMLVEDPETREEMAAAIDNNDFV